MAFIAITRHNSDADSSYSVKKTYQEAVDEVHDHFLSYDFEMKDGKPFDSGNDDGEDGGFRCFSGVVIFEGKVAEFTHCDGEGPEGEIRKG